MDIVEKRDALARGLRFYCTGKPCKYGHIAERYLTGACVVCVREKARIQYQNADKVLERQRLKAWRLANPEAFRTSQRKWQAKNKAKLAAYSRAWVAANKERADDIWRSYRERNREKINLAAIVRNKINPEIKRTHKLRRRALETNAPGSHTADELAALAKAQKWKCAYCKVSLGQRYCVDHIVPLSRGGSNWISNLQLACRACNSSKGAKDPITFAQAKGLLL
jgi:5-methylcytosine-specific restriction endonuclease McrA